MLFLGMARLHRAQFGGSLGGRDRGPLARRSCSRHSVGALLPRQGAVSSRFGLWAAPTSWPVICLIASLLTSFGWKRRQGRDRKPQSEAKRRERAKIPCAAFTLDACGSHVAGQLGERNKAEPPLPRSQSGKNGREGLPHRVEANRKAARIAARCANRGEKKPRQKRGHQVGMPTSPDKRSAHQSAAPPLESARPITPKNSPTTR